MPLLFLLFLATPILEIAVFIEVGGLIGLPATIALIIVNTILGATLLRVQGLSALVQAQQSLARGEPPVGPAIDALGLLVAGALMITPGLVTDAAGFLLLVPPLRRMLIGALLRRLARSAAFHVRVFHAPPPGSPPGQTGPGAPGGQPRWKSEPVIDADFEIVDAPPRRPADAAAKKGGGGDPKAGEEAGDSPTRPLPPRR